MIYNLEVSVVLPQHFPVLYRAPFSLHNFPHFANMMLANTSHQHPFSSTYCPSKDKLSVNPLSFTSNYSLFEGIVIEIHYSPQLTPSAPPLPRATFQQTPNGPSFTATYPFNRRHLVRESTPTALQHWTARQRGVDVVLSRYWGIRKCSDGIKRRRTTVEANTAWYRPICFILWWHLLIRPKSGQGHIIQECHVLRRAPWGNQKGWRSEPHQKVSE